VAKHRPVFLFVCAALNAFVTATSAGSALLISEFLANPNGSPDSPREFVELLATENIDFHKTPYCVVFTSNGKADERGWVGGGSKTYGFNITSGIISRGGVTVPAAVISIGNSRGRASAASSTAL